MKFVFVTSSLVLLLALCAGPSGAQSNIFSGDIAGVVTDTTGARIAQANISFSNPATSVTRTLPTAWLSRLIADSAVAPIFRANSSRPFNLLAGTVVNNDRHSTTDRPPFACRTQELDRISGRLMPGIYE